MQKNSGTARAQVAAVICCVWALSPVAVDALQSQGTYQLVDDWPHYPIDMKFEMGTGIAVGADGVIYTIARDVDHWAGHPLAMSRYKGRGSIARWTREGGFLGYFAEEQEFIGPHSMYIDDEGFVWVVDREGHQVVKMTPEGDRLMAVGEYGVWGDDPGHFNGPTGVAFLPDGRFVVSDGYWNSRLIWFASDGTYLKEVGGLGTEPGKMASPHSIALAPDGTLIVGNYCGLSSHPYVTAPGQIKEERLSPLPGCVQRYDVWSQEGEYIGNFGGDMERPGLPLSVAVYGDRIYFGHTGSRGGRQHISIVDAETKRIVQRLEDVSVYVHQMAMDAQGDIYIASVYPEHDGQPRGIEGPSFLRWTKR